MGGARKGPGLVFRYTTTETPVQTLSCVDYGVRGFGESLD